MGWGVGVGAKVAVGTGVTVAIGVAVGTGVGMTWGVKVGIASTMALARWSMSWLSSSSDGPQAGRARAKLAKTSPTSAQRIGISPRLPINKYPPLVPWIHSTSFRPARNHRNSLASSKAPKRATWLT